MQKLQELRGRRDTIAASARELHAAHKDKSWDQAAGEKYDQLINELSDIDAAIGREQKFLDTLADSKVDDAVSEAKAKRVRAAGGQLKLCQIAPDLLVAFRITRFDRLFEIHDEEWTALDAFRA